MYSQIYASNIPSHCPLCLFPLSNHPLPSLNTKIFGQSLLYAEETPSTQTFMLQHHTHLPNGTVFWAAHQTAGITRKPGKAWHSQPGHSLCFTLLVKCQENCALTLDAVTGALVAVLGRDKFAFKAPNDVVGVGQGKVAGVMIDAVQQGEATTALIGVGVNLKAVAAEGTEFGGCGETRSAGELLSCLLEELERRWV